MAVKNWLIRTTQNQLLGPVSKEKIIELIRAGKLEEDDEVCSGNGYWFYIREDDLVEKYLVGDVPQSFNPVYEIEPILTRQVRKDKTSTLGSPGAVPGIGSIEIDENPVLPEGEDLEYPDIEINLDDDDDEDITVVGQMTMPPVGADAPEGPPVDLPSTPPEPVQVSAGKDTGLMSRAPDKLDGERSRPGKLPSDDDLAYPDLGMDQSLIDQKFESPEPEGEEEDDEDEDYTMVGAAPVVEATSLDELEPQAEPEADFSSDVAPVISQEIQVEEQSVEIFDEVDPEEGNFVEESFEEELSPQIPQEMPKPKRKKKAQASKKTASKKTSKRSREFADREEVTGDDVIDEALKQSKKKRAQRGRRRGVDTYLILFFGSIIIIAFAVIFYFKVVLKKKLPFIGEIQLISPVHAQTLVSVKKKR